MRASNERAIEEIYHATKEIMDRYSYTNRVNVVVPRNSVIELSQPTASMSDVKIEYQYTGGGAGGL